MKTGEVWISDFWDGRNGVLIGSQVEPNVWECTYLLRVSEKEYAKDEGGRVSSRIDPSAFYTGEGQLYEEEFSKFYHSVEGIKIVPMPEFVSAPEMSIDSSGFASFKYS